MLLLGVIFQYCEHPKWNSTSSIVGVWRHESRRQISPNLPLDKWEIWGFFFLVILVNWPFLKRRQRQSSISLLSYAFILEGQFFPIHFLCLCHRADFRLVLCLVALHVGNVPRLPQTHAADGTFYKVKSLGKCHEYLTVIYGQEEEES